MNHDELAKAYTAFFLKNPAGQSFMDELDRLIDDAHMKAEGSADHAAYFTQHARGVRKVKEHITAVITPTKKGPRMKQ